MQEHKELTDARRFTWRKWLGLLIGGGAGVAATAIAVTVAGNGFGGGNIPVAGSGSAPPHTTYQQPLVDPINLGATTFPATPLPDADPSEASPPPGSGG